MSTKDILNVTQALQATALVGNSLGFVKKKKKTSKDFIKVATTNLIGIPLIQAQGKLINAI